MFQFRSFPTYTYLIQCTLHGYCPCGLPHSEIHGSMDICSFPWLIAACHVLLRLLMPRHSPCALSSLTNQKQFNICSRCELCRLLQRFEIVIMLPFILSDVVPQLKYASHTFLCTNLSVALRYHFHHIVQFSRCSLQLLLQSDLKIQLPVRSSNPAAICLVGPSGLEPPTLRLSVVRSSQLSYGPLFDLVEITGIEPVTSCLQGRRSPS